jgi:DNA-directed RNA polymerase subunit K
MHPHHEFTKYEIARIIGARALQVAMDAPILLKISEKELKAIRYDALKIAEKEFEQGVLPISINRPMPKRKVEKLREIKEESIDDEKIIQKEKEIEEEITEKAVEDGFAAEDDDESSADESTGEEE